MNTEIVGIGSLLSFPTKAHESQCNRNETGSRRSPAKLCVRNPFEETGFLFGVM
jgi:hypothetical protein